MTRARWLLLATLAATGMVTTGLAVLRHEPARAPVEPRPAVGQANAHTDVVLVIGCTVRADQLSPWGAPTNVTPWLAGMAAEGTRFETTVAAAPWTKPAVTALLTSQHGLVAGVVEASPRPNRRVLQDRWTTVAERMRASGRATVGLSANPNADAPFGFHQGFDHYASATDLGLERQGKVEGGPVVDRALDLVEEVDGPLYLQLVLTDTHQPDTSRLLDRVRLWAPGLSRQVLGYRAR